MIKIKYEDLNNNALASGLSKLNNTGFKNLKTSYWIAKITRKVDQEVATARDLFQKISAKYQAEPLKEGETAATPNMEKQEAFNADMKAFMEHVVEIPYDKLKFEELNGAELTPNEVLALEGIIDGLDASVEIKTA